MLKNRRKGTRGKRLLKNYTLSFKPLISVAVLTVVFAIGCSQKQTETQSKSTPHTSQGIETPSGSSETAAQIDTSTSSAESATTAIIAETPSQAAVTENKTERQTPPQKLIPLPAALQFTVNDPDGNLRQSQNWFTGAPVVLNFWGTWCPPCRREVPALVEINNEFSPKGVKMVSLSYNDTPEQVKKFVQANNMSWEQVLVDQNVVASFGIQGFPTTIFYTADGKELGRLVGGRTHADFHAAFSMLVK